MTTPSDNSPLNPASVPAGTPATPPVHPMSDNPGSAAPAATGSVPPGPAGPVALPAQTGGAAAVTGPAVVVGTYPEYALAQKAVDHLSDNKFPVQRTSIIGTDLRLVETVLGRLTIGRAALAGAASGAWFGVFLGLLFGLFSDSGWLAVILTTVLIGALWGAIFGAIAHAATGGRRDFTSRSSLQAATYEVHADTEVADEARTLLISLNWRASGAQ